MQIKPYFNNIEDPKLQELWDMARPYINGTPPLVSLLYDLDYTPEQIVTKEHFLRMLLIVDHFMQAEIYWRKKYA